MARLSAEGVFGAEQLVDRCLDLVGAYELAPETREQLVAHAQQGGDVQPGAANYSTHVSEILQLIVATQEYQFA